MSAPSPAFETIAVYIRLPRGSRMDAFQADLIKLAQKHECTIKRDSNVGPVTYYLHARPTHPNVVQLRPQRSYSAEPLSAA